MASFQRARKVESHFENQREVPPTKRKIGTHARTTKAPRYFRPQLAPAAPDTRSASEVLRGKSAEMLRQQAISRLGSIGMDFMRWWIVRPVTYPRTTGDPDRPSTFVDYWTIGVGGRMLASYTTKHTTEEEDWRTWATKQKEPMPEYAERLVSLLGFSLDAA